ncbi:virginiamycin B lyase [Actinoplanes sp. OR16]|uniref:Vgb family protein n=1 Tax=Actinoplanes sp. OR16 TaxID=946334 RepID=UPI000F6EEF06|nr:hydrolase [Actinoplanes sp. OR16]BBH71715.1 virginiamycin B lyase [Actinoplanes sp. OR16]
MDIALDGWAPYAVAADAAGDIWLTVLTPPGLARVTPDLHHEPIRSGQPMLLSIAGDTIWYTRSDGRLVRRDPTGAHVEFELPDGSAPYGIAAGDDDVWFTAPGINKIGRLFQETISWYELPIPESRPAMIALDHDGTPWAALNGAGALARIRDGKVEIIALPEGSAPVGVAPGIWYADIAGGAVGRVDADGTVHHFPLPDRASRPHAVATAPDGSCWATLWGTHQLARVTTGGDIEIHDLSGKEPHGLCVTGDQVWVAMESGSLSGIQYRHDDPR